ncbi:hypothetical protein D9M68_788290 [compost metagenome]
MASSTTPAWTIAATGERAPARTLAALRAMAAVAVMPPNSGASRLPRPWPSSSALGSWRVPAMPSATTAHSSDSMAPSMAMAKAGASSWRTSSKVSPRGWPSGPGSCQGQAKLGRKGGMPGWLTPSTT